MLNHCRPAAFSRRLHIVALFALVATLIMLRPAQAQSGTCTTSSRSSYSVTVCITQPSNGATVSGVQTVTATASVSGSSASVGKLLFSLDGAYLLTDLVAPYTFQLPTDTFANGSHTLSVYAVMRDGFTTSAPLVTLNFANAGTPPPAPDFVPVAPGPRPAGQPLIMAATGDGASGEINSGLVTQMIDGWNPDVFLYLGDVYEKGTYTEFYNWYGQPNYHYGLFRDVTNPVIGNHEYENGVAPGYFQYWNNVPNYYSYNAGDWHFIALNSNSQFNQTSTSSPQYQWLLNDLNSNSAPCSLAYFHHPVLSVGPQGNTTRMNAIWSLLAQKGVDVVLTGHDHSYQRWKPLGADLNPSAGGTTSFVAGAGGHGVQDFVRSDDRLVFGNGSASSYGALYFKLNPKSAEYRYVNTAGQILDQGTIACSGAAADTSAPTVPSSLGAATSASGHVALSWGAAWDETGVAGYGIYRDGALIATVGGGETGYVDTNVGLNVTYSYQVDAVDPGGRRSALSNSATITRPSQATLIFNPTADTYVQSGVSSTNYGTASTLKVDGSPDTQSFLRFNLQGIAGTISSATLRLYANNGSSTGYQVYSLTSSSWSEANTLYSNKPPTGSQAGSSGGFTSGSWPQVNLLSLVTGSGELNIGLKTTSSTSMNFSSREGANPPQLVVNIAAGGSGPTATAVPPTATATNTPSPTPTDTSTPIPPTATPTNTPAPPTPTPTNTPTNTPVLTPSITPSNTPVPPTPTSTNTSTPVPPTNTPTNTPVEPTNTPAPPTSTPTNTPTNTPANTPAASPTAVAATTLTLTPLEDAYVSDSGPNTNYGKTTNLRVDTTAPVQRSYLRFNVQGVGGPVTKATLRIYAASASTKGYEVRTLTGTWSETTVTFNTGLSIGATPAGGSGPIASNTWAGVDVTSLVAGLPGGSGQLDLALTGISSTAINFNSREGVNAPQLIVEFGGSGGSALAADEGTPLLPDLPDDSIDGDGDGAPDALELLSGSNPAAADSDGDGLLDLWEIESGLAPTDAAGDNGAAGDPDGDGIVNLDEQRNGSDPLYPNTSPLFLPFVGHD